MHPALKARAMSSHITDTQDKEMLRQVIESKIFTPGERMIERQLHSSSDAWEKRQRERLLRTGSRSYQMWEAYEQRDVHEFLESVGDMLFTEESTREFH